MVEVLGMKDLYYTTLSEALQLTASKKEFTVPQLVERLEKHYPTLSRERLVRKIYQIENEGIFTRVRKGVYHMNRPDLANEKLVTPPPRRRGVFLTLEQYFSLNKCFQERKGVYLETRPVLKEVAKELTQLAGFEVTESHVEKLKTINQIDWTPTRASRKDSPGGNRDRLRVGDLRDALAWAIDQFETLGVTVPENVRHVLQKSK